MQKALRLFLIFFAASMLLICSTGVVLAASVATSVATDGLVVIRVHEKGPDGVHFTAPIPASLVGLGASFAHRAAAEDLDEARRQLEPYRDTLHQALAGLEDAGDVTLVTVEDGTDHVQIAKRGRNLVIDVDSDDAEVHVTVPLPLVRQVVESVLG
jgi:hypothetical protein